jgi:hypothetical protein
MPHPPSTSHFISIHACPPLVPEPSSERKPPSERTPRLGPPTRPALASSASHHFPPDTSLPIILELLMLASRTRLSSSSLYARIILGSHFISLSKSAPQLRSNLNHPSFLSSARTTVPLSSRSALVPNIATSHTLHDFPINEPQLKLLR